MKKRFNITILLIIFIAVVLLVLDATDTFGSIGIVLNYDAWNVIVVLFLFIITYTALDSRDVNRKQNQEEISRELLLCMYNGIIECIDLIESKEFELVKRKINIESVVLDESKEFQTVIQSPFTFDDRIFSFANDGIISAKQMHDYIMIKQKYEHWGCGRNPGPNEVINRRRSRTCIPMKNG